MDPSWRVVDLSHPLDDRTPVYPGDPPVRLRPARLLEREGFRVQHVHLGSHSGTHVDAPAHVVEVAPVYDSAEITGIAAAHAAYELLSAMGRRPS